MEPSFLDPSGLQVLPVTRKTQHHPSLYLSQSLRPHTFLQKSSPAVWRIIRATIPLPHHQGY